MPQRSFAILASLAAFGIVPALASLPVANAQGPLLTLQTIGGSDVASSPDHMVPLRATLSNSGEQGTNVSFNAYTVLGWALQVPAPFYLDAGESRVVVLGVNVGGASQSLVKLTATPSDGSQRVSVLWRVDARVRLSVHAARPVFSPLDEVTGSVSADYPDGTLAQNVTVRVSQSWAPLNAAQSTTQGVTDGRGIYLFDLGRLDEASRLPGQHDLYASAPISGSTARASYSVSITQAITG